MFPSREQRSMRVHLWDVRTKSFIQNLGGKTENYEAKYFSNHKKYLFQTSTVYKLLSHLKSLFFRLKCKQTEPKKFKSYILKMISRTIKESLKKGSAINKNTRGIVPAGNSR